MPSVMKDRRTVAANATTANILDGKIGQKLRRDGVVRFLATEAAVGLFGTLIIGDRVVMHDEELTQIKAAGAGSGIQDPGDLEASEQGFAGEELDLRIRNSTAAGIEIRTKVEVVDN